ncbi:Fanconi anemia core complex-associated protein 24-like isoform X2 [Homarus americanus]|nr:Fanconi anemia core complex-associated protein 24-like isoform X2 [Homarus americanus]
MQGTMSTVSQSPHVRSVQVSMGFIVVSLSWRETQLMNRLLRLTRIEYSEGKSYRRRIVKLQRSNRGIRRIVIGQCTINTFDHACDLQKFVCFELGLSFIPVDTVEEAADLLAEMVSCETKFHSNPFYVKPKTASNSNGSLLKTVRLIRGLGDVRSRKLLQHFPSIQAITAATQESLEKVVGVAVASSVHNFFHQPLLL